MAVVIGKVKDEGGCWSNMAAYGIVFQDKTWRTSEAIFQALRFGHNEEIKELIRGEPSPMGQK